MDHPLHAARLLRAARAAARLSQRQLAARAGTSQSVIARIEGGFTSPGVATLSRLLDAARVDARVTLEVRPTAAAGAQGEEE